MKDGLWVAMALHNVARTYLRMGLLKEARQYLYPALNHATPFVTWCEERGVEKGTTKTSGDRQHLWTPLAVLQYLTDAFYFEDENEVHLFSGILCEWFNKSKKVAIKNLRTSFGKTSFSLKQKNNGYEFSISTDRIINKKIVLHYFSNDNKDKIKIIQVNSNKFSTFIL